MTSDPPLRLSDAFIVAKTVTYVSSLPVTYVTTLYISIARAAPIGAPNHRLYGNGIRILRRAALAQDDRKGTMVGSNHPKTVSF